MILFLGLYCLMQKKANEAAFNTVMESSTLEMPLINNV